MATKRKRTSKPNTAAAPATDASKPGASGRVAPRKRTDVPPAKPKPRAAGTPHVEENEGQTPLEQTSRAAKVRAKAAARLKEDAAAIVDDAAKDDGAEASTEAERGKRRRERAEAKPRKKRWPLVVAGSVLLVVLLIVGGFSWDRWLRYDDAAEFQGEWQTHGTTAVVVIDGETIKLTEDVSWSYKLDTDAKTISYTFGNMEGSGRYRFSLDRSQLVEAGTHGSLRWRTTSPGSSTSSCARFRASRRRNLRRELDTRCSTACRTMRRLRRRGASRWRLSLSPSLRRNPSRRLRPSPTRAIGRSRNPIPLLGRKTPLQVKPQTKAAAPPTPSTRTTMLPHPARAACSM